MKRILQFIYGRRYNAVLLISASTALGWAIFLTADYNTPDAPLYLGLEYLNEPTWQIIAYCVGIFQLFTMFTTHNTYKKIAFTAGAFLWGATATDVFLSSALWVAVINYSGLTLAMVFAGLDLAFSEQEAINDRR